MIWKRKGRKKTILRSDFIRLKNIDKDDLLVLGLATTGLKDDDEIIEISLLNFDGESLFNEKIKPKINVSEEAYQIHGISRESLENKKNFSDINEKLIELVRGKILLTYNYEYTVRIFNQTASKYNLKSPLLYINIMFCVMEAYGPIYNDANLRPYYYKYCKLTDAALNEKISFNKEEDQDAKFMSYLTYEITKSVLKDLVDDKKTELKEDNYNFSKATSIELKSEELIRKDPYNIDPDCLFLNTTKEDD